jgi:ribosomal protein S18 acetylase RimI-like enzyme
MTEGVLHQQLEIRRVCLDLERPLAELFAAFVAAGDDRTFHPHPFTPEAAAERARYRGKDVYAVAVAAGRALGYGMLRGWDEGYEIPSLGIAIHPAARALGLGRALMLYLHAEARRRGAPRIRLKVYPDNESAIALYRSLGYDFGGAREAGQLVGVKTLRGA